MTDRSAWRRGGHVVRIRSNDWIDLGICRGSGCAERGRPQGSTWRRNGPHVSGAIGNRPRLCVRFRRTGGRVPACFSRWGTLPLYLVQAATCASVGLAALIGAVTMGWRVSRYEMAVLSTMTVALVLLAGAAQPARVTHVAPVVEFVLAAALGLCVLLAIPAWSRRGGVPLACLAGTAFAVLAVASRPLLSVPLSSWPLSPLAWLSLASAGIGQLLLAAALQRGSTTATGASMDAVTMVLASVAGTAFLADPIAAGRTWWVVIGLIVIVAGVFVMARVSAVPGDEEPNIIPRVVPAVGQG